MDITVSSLNTAIGKKQNTANLVTEWQTTPDDTHYPSEKLVKDSIDEASSSVTTHANRADNPHSVTKEQVGLGNVLNVAAYSKTEIDDKIEAINTAIASMQTDLGLSVNDDGVLCVTYETV